jgi:secreted trypsin-like serine protease
MRPLRLAVLVALLIPATAFAKATPRIVGGSTTTISKYPFQVALLSSAATPDDEWQYQFCGGSILDATHVITAAHCLYDTVASGHAAPPQSLKVLARTAVLADPGDPPDLPPVDASPDQQVVAVAATSFDPDYDPNLTDHDAAIVTLAAPITLESGLAQGISILSDVSHAEAGDAVDVSGWGSTVKQPPDFSHQPSYPHDLQAVTTQIVPDATCNADHGGGITDRMICAGANNEDSCQGDSGGPLVADLSSTATPDFRLVGIVSTGIGCGWKDFPGIYTRAFEPTIESFLNSHPPQAPIQTTLATLTGTAAPGQTLTCNPGTWLGGPDFTYSFGTQSGTSPTYTVTSQDVGRLIRCQVDARNAGGFGSAFSNTVLVQGSPTPPPTTTTTTTTPPPPPPPRDTTPPVSTVRYARCQGTRCVLNVQVTDPPYTAGLGKLSVKARVAEIVRCRRAADRRRGRVCHRTRSRTATVSRLGGTVFTAVLRKAKPGTYTFTIVATDAAGNKQAKPLRVKLKLKANKRR